MMGRDAGTGPRVGLVSPPATRLSLGEWCVRRGLATREEIETCLREQRRMLSDGRPAVRMGELLVDRGILTRRQVSEALAEQKEEIRQCPRCEIRVNVPLGNDGVEHRCPRCERLLIRAGAGGPLDAVFEPPVVVSPPTLPDEVTQAASDPAARFGKYLLLREVGRGGVGRVYLAWDTYLEQHVALKRLLGSEGGGTSGLDTAHAQSLVKEARSAIRLRHPGIASVFDVGRVDREFYISMEYIDGETLHDRIVSARQRGRTSPLYEDLPASLRMLAEVARAVHHAHTRPSPVIHCDLKPGNILVDREGHAHVVDFGLARNLHQDVDSGDISGTPSYMAPEQASGRTDRIDVRTDVYAVGAILYEMLSGRPPFVGMTAEILDRLQTEMPPPVSDLRPRPREGVRVDLPETAARALEALAFQCLRKDRDERPSTLEAVAAALEAAIAAPAPALEPATVPSETPEAPPVTLPLSTPYPPSRRGLWILGWAVAAALVLALVSQIGRLRDAVAERRIENLIGNFAPEQALEEALELARRDGASGLYVEEALRVVRLKQRLARVSPEPVGTLDASRAAALAQRLLPDLDPSDRLAVAILLVRAGRPAEARSALLLLRDTPWEPSAERYLSCLEH